MQVELIDNDAALDRLESAWNRLYVLDPEAQVFLSWTWLRHWFRITPYRWRVLAAKSDKGDYVALLPLAQTGVRRYGVELHQTLYMGGKPISDHTGFLADPAHAAPALAALGRCAAERLSWDWFRAEHVTDTRLDAFLAGCAHEQLGVREEPAVASLYSPLNSDWDGFLAQNLSANCRSNLRRCIRTIERLPDFRTTVSSPETAERDIEIVLSVWRARWGALAPNDLERYRQMLRHMAAEGRLWLRMLWMGREPMAGLAGLIDPVKRQFCYYFSGFDAAYTKLSPGKVIIGWGIRDAIEMGCVLFDFLLGGEEYKSAYFGARQRWARCVTIERRSIPSRVKRRLGHWIGTTKLSAKPPEPRIAHGE